MDTKIAKKSLRALMRLKARSHDSCLSEAEIVKKVLMQKDVQEAKGIFVYVSYDKEVPTRLLIEHFLKQGKIVCVPRIISPGHMIPVQITSPHQLRKGKYNILEPVSLTVYKETIDVVIVPGLTFDLSGNRLGHGGGYYDRFLARGQYKKSFGLAFAYQVVECVLCEPHDVQLDAIIAV